MAFAKTSVIMEAFWIIILCCLIFGSFGEEVKDNETLIYHWDVHHKMYYYCQFGTNEEVTRGGNIEAQCFRRNNGVQLILPDGVKTYPYLAFGSTVGFVLKCKDIPNADLHDCRKYVYTWCKYTCKSSNIVQDAQCQQKGPKKNITAEWSVADPCPVSRNSTSLLNDKYILATPNTAVGQDNTTGAFANKSDVGVVSGNVSIPASSLIATSTGDILMPASIVFGVVFLALCVGVTVFLIRRRHNKLKRRKHTIVGDDGGCIYENLRVVYTRTPLVPTSTPPPIALSVPPPASRSVPTSAPLPITPPITPSVPPSVPQSVDSSSAPSILPSFTPSVSPSVPSTTLGISGEYRIGERIESPVFTSNRDSSDSLAPSFSVTENQDSSMPDLDKRIEKAFNEILTLAPDLEDIKVCRHESFEGLSDLEINKALDDFVSMRSAFSDWDKTKIHLQEDNGIGSLR